MSFLDEDSKYMVGAKITGGICFLIIWIISMFAYGPLGFFLGWIPAGILGGILGLIWPITVGLTFLFVGYLINHSG